jgi:aspartyl/asparaginyl-tRNA synthetase
VEEDTGVDEDDEDQEQLENIASAMLENPEIESLLIAHQDAKKKIQYTEARKMLAKTRVSREFYPVRWGEKKGNKSESQHFDGDFMRCRKYGNKV